MVLVLDGGAEPRCAIGSRVHLKSGLTTVTIRAATSTPTVAFIAAVSPGRVGELEPVADERAKGGSACGDDADVLLKAGGDKLVLRVIAGWDRDRGDSQAQGLSPVVEHGVGVAPEPDLRDGLGDADEDSTVTKAEDAEEVEARAALHLEAPDDGNGQRSEADVGEDVAAGVE